MHTEPLPFFRDEVPPLFNRGVEMMAERAADGDEKAAARLADVKAARGGIRVLLEGDGGGELYLVVNGGTMAVEDAPPEGIPVRFAISAPADALKNGLEELAKHDVLSHEKAPLSVARVASAEVEKILEPHRLGFVIVLTDVPADPDEVRITLALGSGELPKEPQFTASLSWDDIEDVRAGELTPQQLFGRLKIKGDASKAMAIGMMLMQRRK